MNEQEPQSEKGNNESFVPEYIFDKAWQESNFLIPANKELRIELRQQLEGFSRYGIMHRPENQKAKDILLARVMAIEAYDEVLHKNKR